MEQACVLKYFNGGLVENKGIEAVITANIIKTKQLNWDVIVNFDRNRGKVIRLPATCLLIMTAIPGYLAIFEPGISRLIYQ